MVIWTPEKRFETSRLGSCTNELTSNRLKCLQMTSICKITWQCIKNPGICTVSDLESCLCEPASHTLPCIWEPLKRNNFYKAGASTAVIDELHNLQILDYFEAAIKGFIVERFAGTDKWWDRHVPPEVREEALQRHAAAKKLNDLLNKPEYGPVEYLNFDGYEKIISRKDNWRSHFEPVFLDKTVFVYKMRIIQSLRNDIRHGRDLDPVNWIRLKLHCYDILAQVYESGYGGADDHNTLMKKFGF